MVELRTKLTESGVLYIPKKLREPFGRIMKIIPEVSCAVFFPANAEYEDVLASLKVIQADLENRIRLSSKNHERGKEVDGSGD